MLNVLHVLGGNNCSYLYSSNQIRMKRQILKTQQKALEINLDKTLYGTFAEIGAGQEVARNFFQAGAAAGTIAKTMSAYDKTYSDAIYGEEKSGRYVCESRLIKMLDHEYRLMEERLTYQMPDTNFFVFADTIAAINYQKTIKGQGWMGVRFQMTPDGPANDLHLHVKMKDNTSHLQKEAIGMLGVNMIYACYRYTDDMDVFTQSLLDNLWGRVEIDMVRIVGEDFDHVDNRLLSFYTVKNGLSPVAIFDKNKKSVHASEFLWKKELIVVRGHFRPPTKVTLDAFESAYKQFIQEEASDKNRVRIIAEITLDYLELDGHIDEKDYIARAEMLNALGYNVIISNCANHEKLIEYLSDYRINNLGLVIGVRELSEIIKEKYFNNQDGRLLIAFGELFNRHITVYVYPAIMEEPGRLTTAKTLMVPDGIHFLYKHLVDNRQIVEIEGYDESLLNIMPWKVLESIKQGDTYWENVIPQPLVELIKKNKYFDYNSKQLDLAQ